MPSIVCPNCVERELEPWHEGWLKCTGCGQRYPTEQLTSTHPVDGGRKYEIDLDALESHPDPIGTWLDLQGAINSPRWNLELACRPCYDWDSGRRVKRPNPPRAFAPESGCAGCTWSLLDGVSVLPEQERLLRLEALHTSWQGQLDSLRAQTCARKYEDHRAPGEPLARWLEVKVPEESGTRRVEAKEAELRAIKRQIERLSGTVANRTRVSLEAARCARQARPRGVVDRKDIPVPPLYEWLYLIAVHCGSTATKSTQLCLLFESAAELAFARTKIKQFMARDGVLGRATAARLEWSRLGMMDAGPELPEAVLRFYTAGRPDTVAGVHFDGVWLQTGAIGSLAGRTAVLNSDRWWSSAGLSQVAEEMKLRELLPQSDWSAVATHNC